MIVLRLIAEINDGILAPRSLDLALPPLEGPGVFGVFLGKASLAWRSSAGRRPISPRRALRERTPNQISTWLSQLAGVGREVKMNIGMFGRQPSPAAEALQQAMDDAAPADQIKNSPAKYNAPQKTRPAAPAAAQANPRQGPSAKQAAQAAQMGLLRADNRRHDAE